jgi:hypothetical protein
MDVWHEIDSAIKEELWVATQLAIGCASDGVEHRCFYGACFGDVLSVPLRGCSVVALCWVFAQLSIITEHCMA